MGRIGRVNVRADPLCPWVVVVARTASRMEVVTEMGKVLQ